MAYRVGQQKLREKHEDIREKHEDIKEKRILEERRLITLKWLLLKKVLGQSSGQ